MKKILLAVIFILVVQFVQAEKPTAYFPLKGNADITVGSLNGTVYEATLPTERFGKSSNMLILLTEFNAVAGQTYRSKTSGDWSSAATWEIFDGNNFIPASVAPSSVDGVITVLNGHNVTVNSVVNIDQTIINAGGTLSLTSTLTLNDGDGDDVIVNGDLVFLSGVINGAGNMKVNNSFNWQSGSIQSATVFLAPGSVSSKTTTGISDVNSGLLTNNGNFTWTQGEIILGNGGTFNNGVTGTISATGNDAMNANCCSVSFNNAGIFTKSTGTGTTSLNVDGTNSGTINVNSGTISSSRSFTNSGTISAANGKTFLINAGNFILNNGSKSIGAGNFQLSAGTITINADEVTPATATNYLFTAGTMNGSGTLNIEGGMEWQSGSIQLVKVQLITGSVSSKTTAGVSDINNGVLTNNGNFTWSQGNIVLGNFGIFNNGVTGTITATGDDAMNANCCAVSFNNAGIFTKSTGTGTTTLDVDGNNSGTINVNSGTISSLRSFTNSGTISAASGKTFLINGGNFSLNNGSKSKGAGNFQLSAGTLTVNADEVTPATATNYLFTAGTMNGSGTLNIEGGMEWQSGSIQLAKVQLMTGSVSSKTTTGLSNVNNGVLTNNGNFTWDAGNITISNFGIFNNSATGTIDITGNDVMNSGCCIVSFNNAGTVFKSNATGTTTFDITATNTGIIKGFGILNFTGPFTSDGIIAPGNSPGLLTVNGAQPLSGNSTLQIEMKDGSGPGSGHDQLIRDGSITLSGALVVTETGAIPDGTYTIIDLAAGNVSGSFSTVTLPQGYVLQVNASNVQITRNIAVPLTLLSFIGKVQNSNALLQWKTANEINVNRFEIERSDEGQIFVTVGTVMPGKNIYTFNDVNIFNSKSIAFYRLKSIDADGRFSYSGVISLSNTLVNQFSLFPNPVKDFVTLSGLQQKGIIYLFTTEGKLLKQITVNAQRVIIDMGIYPKGNYILQYKLNGLILNQKIVKQ